MPTQQAIAKVESERALLSALIWNADSIPRVIRELDLAADDFMSSNAKTLYVTILGLVEDGTPIDAVSLWNEINRNGHPAIPKDYLFEVVELQTSLASIPYHAEEIRSASFYREALSLSDQIKLKVDNSGAKEDILHDIEAFVSNSKASIDSKASRRGLTGELRELVQQHGDTVSAHFCQQATGMTSRDGKKKVYAVLSRFCKEGLLERTASAGVYRVVQSDFDFEEISTVSTQATVDIQLPFGFEEYALVYPKSIVCFAGQIGSGKTTLLLECARLNMKKHNITYLCTETSKEEVRDRINNCDGDTHWTFRISDEIGTNYIDAVDPDGLTIIDYIEETEGEPFKIVGKIAKIFNKLNDGIVFMAIQKNKGVSHGIGGEQTKAKAAIYFTVDADYPGAIIRCQKVRKWADPRINPHGFCMKFKIYDGINLIPMDTWGPEVIDE